ncbi:MAG: Hydroxypyruvate reductase [Alphaproteobacteria bacterium MarineAlpha5_Bin9]|nr:MAG: Hydroxypyruvate reductase [Alphaproteobacteria bacterium MarineAlpha5_Bin9]
MSKVLISDSMDNIAKELFIQNNIDCDVITDLSSDDLKNIINQYDALVVRSATKVTKDIILSSQKLKIIGRAGAGTDNIDIKSAKEKNIIVMNTPGANTNATAEHTIALILSLLRNITKANFSTHKGLWEKKLFKGVELKDKNLGLIGFGNVSARVAEIANGFGMKIYTFSKSFKDKKNLYPYVTNLSFDEILTTCDIISLHCKSSPDNKPLFNTNEFSKMKDSSFIINTARGSLINEIDLKNALENKIIMGAALDVYMSEPATKNILFNTKNLILSPHIAASTFEAQKNVAIQIAKQIIDYFIEGKIVNNL